MANAKTALDLVREANALVEGIDAEEAIARRAEPGVLFVDVRDAPELEQHGRIPGALHVSRGTFEFIADPASAFHDARLAAADTLVLYCATGGRSALAGKAALELGYTRVFNLIGGIRAWKQAGGPVEG